MLKRFQNTKGETIAETVIALMILAIGITFSGTIMANSLGSITSSKSRIVAVNIAREGIEAMRNIRDTNWLKFSGDRRGCWNYLPGDFPDSCDGSPLIEAADYIIYKDENQRWRLTPHVVTDDPAPSFDNSWLYLMDIDTSQDTDGDNDFFNDKDLYNHHLNFNNAAVGSGNDPLGRENSDRTAFKRVIHIDYLDNNGAALGAGSPSAEYNRMVVESTVSWFSGGRDLTVTLITHLTDYFGRDNLEN